MRYKTKDKTETGNMKKSSPWLPDLGRAGLSLAYVVFVAAAVAGIASPLFLPSSYRPAW